MERIAQHKVLVAGDSYDSCCRQVHKFFDLTSLVVYDCIQVQDDKCLAATAEPFKLALAEAEQRNRLSVASLVKELQQTGVATIGDLNTLEHGYPSKILHVLTHFLDGFIGIDSYFYNLTDDSHWLSEQRRLAIAAEPQQYWLIHIDCYSATPDEAGILRL